MDEKTKQEMIEAVMKVSNICSKTICPNCQFMNENWSCNLVNDVPECWDAYCVDGVEDEDC